MRFILATIVLCACGDAPAADFLEPCDPQVGCAEAEDFCNPDLGVCTRICRASGLPARSEREECVPSADCPGACCLLGAVWAMGFDSSLAGSGVCAPFVVEE